MIAFAQSILCQLTRVRSPSVKGLGKRGGKIIMGIQQWNGVFLAFSLSPCVLSLLRFLFGDFFFISAYHIQSTSFFSALSLFVPDPLSIMFPLHPYLVFFLQYVHSLTLMPARLFLIPVHPPNKTWMDFCRFRSHIFRSSTCTGKTHPGSYSLMRSLGLLDVLNA